MLNPDSVSEKGYDVPTVAQLVDEAYILVAAAADTTGNALTVAAYNTVRNPDIYKRLTAELRAAFPDPNGEMDLSTLDRLPYLVRGSSVLSLVYRRREMC
jgi:cytochrome P450